MDRSGPSANAKPRKELNWWHSFNSWWRDEYEKLGRRPRMQEVDDWYHEHAERIWGPEKPSLEATRDHAKCLRSKKELREYFQRYNAKKQRGRPFNDLRQCRGNQPRSGGGGSINQLMGATAANSSQSPRSNSDPGGGGGGGSGTLGSYDDGGDGASGGSGAQVMYVARTTDMTNDGGLDQPLRSRDRDSDLQFDYGSPCAHNDGSGMPDGVVAAAVGAIASSARRHEPLGPLEAAGSSGEDALLVVRSRGASPVSHGSGGDGGGGGAPDRLNAARHHLPTNYVNRSNCHVNGKLDGGVRGPKLLRSGDGAGAADATDAGASGAADAAVPGQTGSSTHYSASASAAAVAENNNLDSQVPCSGGGASTVTPGSTPLVFSDSRSGSHRITVPSQSRPPPSAVPSTLPDVPVPHSQQAQAPSHAHRVDDSYQHPYHHAPTQLARVHGGPAAQAVASGGGGGSVSGAAKVLVVDEEEEGEEQEAVGGIATSSGATESYPSNLALVSRWLAGIAASALKKRISMDYPVGLTGAACPDGDGGGSSCGNGGVVAASKGKEPEAGGLLSAAWRRVAAHESTTVAAPPPPPPPTQADSQGEEAASMEYGDAESYGAENGGKAEEDASRLTNAHQDLDMHYQQDHHRHDSPRLRLPQEQIPGSVTGTAGGFEAAAVQLAQGSSGARCTASGRSGSGGAALCGGAGAANTSPDGGAEEPSPLGPREPSLSDLPQSPLAMLAVAGSTNDGAATATEAALLPQLSFRSSGAFTGSREETEFLGSGGRGAAAAAAAPGGSSLSAGSKRGAAAAVAALELLGVPSLRASGADGGFPDTPSLHRPPKFLRLEQVQPASGRGGGGLSQRPSVASSGAALTGSGCGGGGGSAEPPPRPPPPAAAAAGGTGRASTPVPGAMLPQGSPPDPFRTPMFQRAIGREGLGGAHLGSGGSGGGGGGEGGSCNLVVAPSVLQARESVCTRGGLPLPPAAAAAAGGTAFLLPPRESLSARGSMPPPPPQLLLPPRESVRDSLDMRPLTLRESMMPPPPPLPLAERSSFVRSIPLNVARSTFPSTPHEHPQDLLQRHFLKQKQQQREREQQREQEPQQQQQGVHHASMFAARLDAATAVSALMESEKSHPLAPALAQPGPDGGNKADGKAAAPPPQQPLTAPGRRLASLRLLPEAAAVGPAAAHQQVPPPAVATTLRGGDVPPISVPIVLQSRNVVRTCIRQLLDDGRVLQSPVQIVTVRLTLPAAGLRALVRQQQQAMPAQAPPS